MKKKLWKNWNEVEWNLFGKIYEAELAVAMTEGTRRVWKNVERSRTLSYVQRADRVRSAKSERKGYRNLNKDNFDKFDESDNSESFDRPDNSDSSERLGSFVG